MYMNDLVNRKVSYLSVDKAHFTTAQQARATNPVYRMVNCRNYISTADSVTCFDIAARPALDIHKFCHFSHVLCGRYIDPTCEVEASPGCQAVIRLELSFQYTDVWPLAVP